MEIKLNPNNHYDRISLIKLAYNKTNNEPDHMRLAVKKNDAVFATPASTPLL